MTETSPDLWRFVAHFHPVLVHLPIGAVMLAAILEALSLRPAWKGMAGSVPAMLAISAPAALTAAGCGWLLAEGGGYDAELLAWHRWTGVASAILVTVLAGLQWMGRILLYRVVLILTVGLVSLAGHHGGSLTHGRDYLTRHAPGPLRALLGADANTRLGNPQGNGAAPATFYVAAVQPILDRHCTTCHGKDKAKGGLRLDSAEAVMKGGESGPAVLAGKAGESPLVGRIRLPPDHDDHMPPEGKSQPSPSEVRVLDWWIGAGGATLTGGMDEATVPSEIRDLVRTIRPGR